MPHAKYPVILIDPPWKYRVYDASDAALHSRAARSQYNTMSADAIKALPIGELAALDSVLFLWTTMPCLPEGLAVMEAWGFTYKTVAFTWVKLNKDGTPSFGLGHYTRSNAEVCLLGTRGNPKRVAKDVSQIIQTLKREHSRKPDEQYDRIMRLFDGPYLEVFARQRWPGWDTMYSNQDSKFLAQPFLIPESALEMSASVDQEEETPDAHPIATSA